MKRVSLHTNILEVAKFKFHNHADVLAIRENQVRGIAPKAEPYTVGQAIDSYFLRLDNEIALDQLKPGTREYWKTVIRTIQRSWLEILKTDLSALQVTQVKRSDCKAWAAEYRKMPSKRESRKASGVCSLSARYYNNSVFALRKVLAEAVEAGRLHANPAEGLGTARVPATKLNLPTKAQFRTLVETVREGTHRTSTASADMIEFLAYSGCRVGEARRVRWKDVNFESKTIAILGDPRTGTKNWATRSIPMISAMLNLLRQMAARRNSCDPEESLLKVGDVRGALIRGCAVAKAPLISHHDLRHLFATVGIENSVDVPTISRWLGHKEGGALAMKTYAHLRDQHSEESAAKVTF